MTLRTSSYSSVLDADVLRYLQNTLGLAPEIYDWANHRKVPYYLQDTFEFRELRLLDQHVVVLAIDRRPKSPTASNIREQMSALQRIAGIPVAYVTGTLASYERNRLIQQKVSFIVPGNQLYLPWLGIDLREYFRHQSKSADAAFNPSTQALLITALLRTPWECLWHPNQAATKLGYTAMTVSRAVRELAGAGIGEVRRESRTQSLDLGARPEDIWDRAKPFLRSPVMRTEWAKPDSALDPSLAPVAGLSALAQHTMVADPDWPVRAVSKQQWLAATRAGLDRLPEPIADAYQWQVWSYDPNLGAARNIVDPLSLTLSLQGESDERIQLGLEELEEQHPW
jgi:hypothetical protein